MAAKTINIEKGRTFWSFQPLAKVTPPTVKNPTWVRTAVDRFILAKLEANGLVPNRRDSRERLIRRAYFDLLGLPPTPADVEAFVNDASPNAYEKLIDRLLESEHVGERWGRHWLDLVRFAESGGYEFDGDRPNAYHYRDFVIKAFNQDMPFDQFVRWQIAGDQLQPKDLQAVAATGFLVAGPYPGQTTSKTRGVDPLQPSRRHGLHAGFVHVGAVHRLCPLSRAQVRSHSPGRLLPLDRLLEPHRFG